VFNRKTPLSADPKYCSPSEDALITLQNKIKEHLLKQWSVGKVLVDADYADLLSVEEVE